jgi:hypothetical protein
VTTRAPALGYDEEPESEFSRMDRQRFSLLWQAALIVVPVAALSGVALYSLREDKASVELQARDGARLLAPELARRVGRSLGALPRLEGRIRDGRVVAPPDYAPLPVPAPWPGRLTPAAAHARAEFRLLLDASSPAPGLVDLARRYPGAVTESGAPLADLALLVALRRGGKAGLPSPLLAELARRVADHPSFLTPDVARRRSG